MQAAALRLLIVLNLATGLFLSSCSTPTLVQVARRRQATPEDRQASRNVKDDVQVRYSVADLDVLNFTDEVKRKLANRSSFHMGVRYGSAGTQATLGALAGAAKVIGWGVSTASGLGLGATYIFGMGQIFDAKGHAQAYEQAFTAIQGAEATYYFHQLGMGFIKVDGRYVLDPKAGGPRKDIPSPTYLTPDGESLYYRVSKVLKVLHDTLSAKIPDLQDLKDANGESSGSASSAKPKDAAPESTKSTSRQTTKTTTTKAASTENVEATPAETVDAPPTEMPKPTP